MPRYVSARRKFPPRCTICVLSFVSAPTWALTGEMDTGPGPVFYIVFYAFVLITVGIIPAAIVLANLAYVAHDRRITVFGAVVGSALPMVAAAFWVQSLDSGYSAGLLIASAMGIPPLAILFGLPIGLTTHHVRLWIKHRRSAA